MSTHQIPDSSACSQSTAASPSEPRFVDWRGRSIAHRQLGGWRGSYCLVGGFAPPFPVSSAFCYFAFAGLYANLVLYLIRVWDESNAGAANDVTNLLGTVYFTSVIGAFVSDAYCGRLWTVVLFQMMLALGYILIAVAVTLRENSSAGYTSGGGLKAFLFFALYVTALGAGSFEPAMSSLGGDQFETPRQRATFFNWLFVSLNLGQLPALTIITYKEDGGKWALGIWISAGAAVLSVLIFVAGAPYCRQYRPGGNPLKRAVEVLVCAARKFRVKAGSKAEELYEVPGEYSVIRGCLKIQHTNKLRWLDKAATITEYDVRNLDLISPWKLCSVTQVEEVKGWISVMPVLLIGVSYFVINSQSSTFFVEQASMMNGSLGITRGFKIPPGSMQIIVVLFAIMGGPLYDYALVPLCQMFTKNPKGITSLQRMGVGILMEVVAMVMAAILEKKRLEELKNGNTISMLWLGPQNAILGVSILFFAVGQIDFFYSEIPQSVRSLGVCLALMSRGLGSYVSTMITSVVTNLSSHHGKKLGWIPHKNLNFGHLDYFYWLLGILEFMTFLLYFIFAVHYTYVNQIKRPYGDQHVKSDPSIVDMSKETLINV